MHLCSDCPLRRVAGASIVIVGTDPTNGIGFGLVCPVQVIQESFTRPASQGTLNQPFTSSLQKQV